MTLATDVAAELRDSSANIFTNVSTNVSDALREFSQHKPRERREIFYTIADSRLVDISIIPEDDLIFGYEMGSFHSLEGVEYEIDQDDEEFRNFKVRRDDDGAYIRMDLKTAPSTSGESVRIAYYEVWTEANLPNGYYNLVRDMATRNALNNQDLYYLNEFMATSTKFNTMTSMLDEAEDRINESISVLTSGKALIGDERDEAVTAIDAVAARITAINAAITSAETYYNTVSVGQPELEYIRSAREQSNSAATSLALARGHLAFESTAQSYRQQASTELSNANAALNLLRGSAEHIRAWISSINLSKEYMARAQLLDAKIQPELSRYFIRRPRRNWRKD